MRKKTKKIKILKRKSSHSQLPEQQLLRGALSLPLTEAEKSGAEVNRVDLKTTPKNDFNPFDPFNIRPNVREPVDWYDNLKEPAPHTSRVEHFNYKLDHGVQLPLSKSLPLLQRCDVNIGKPDNQLLLSLIVTGMRCNDAEAYVAMLDMVVRILCNDVDNYRKWCEHFKINNQYSWKVVSDS